MKFHCSTLWSFHLFVLLCLSDPIFAAEEKNAPSIEEEQKALIGKPAPPIDPRKWINGEAVELTKLKGKLVLIDFFAEWCGPCREGYPKLAEFRKKYPESKLVILGVHTASSETKMGKIEEVLKKYELKYPIAIDRPVIARSWGKTYSAYKVKSIPHAVLVDEDGKIAAHGELDEVIKETDRRLNSQPGKP